MISIKCPVTAEPVVVIYWYAIKININTLYFSLSLDEWSQSMVQPDVSIILSVKPL